MKQIYIYSRKSRFTGKGESIENQIEMCQDYARRMFGDEVRFSIYEDEGFSGKNTSRPEFQRMMAEIRSGQADVLMCYRLDRISRSVSDFSTILEELQDRAVGFVSIKEQFDTTTPMGRAMIYIASVFAELERETIAERVRDNKYKLYRNGSWQGGTPPLGYDVVKVQQRDGNGDKRTHYALKVNEEQVPYIQMVYSKYLELSSMTKVERYMLQNRIPSPKGCEVSKTTVQQIIKNPAYAINTPEVYDYLSSKGADMANDREEYTGDLGIMGYAKTITKGSKNSIRARSDKSSWIVVIGSHQGIISGEKWVQAQRVMEANTDKHPRQDTSHCALLSGLIRCGKCGAPMVVKGNRDSSSGQKLYYYVCSRKSRSGGALCQMTNVHGPSFDKTLVELLKQEFSEGGGIYESLEKLFSKLKGQKVNYQHTIRELDAKIKQKESESLTLTMKLAQATEAGIEEAVFAAIKKTAQEISALKDQRNESVNQDAAFGSQEFNLQLIKDAILSFNSTVDLKPLDDQRNLVRLLIKSIVWQGSESEITLFSDSMIKKTLDNRGQ